jgi:hypothetical protein
MFGRFGGFFVRFDVGIVQKKTKAWLTVPYFDMGLAIFCRFDMVGPPNNPPKMADYDMGCGENHLRNPIDMG